MIQTTKLIAVACLIGCANASSTNRLLRGRSLKGITPLPSGEDVAKAWGERRKLAIISSTPLYCDGAPYTGGDCMGTLSNQQRKLFWFGVFVSKKLV